MGRLNVDPLRGFRFDLAAEDAAAWKGKRVHAVIADHGQFKVAVERRSGYALPLHDQSICLSKSGALI